MGEGWLTGVQWLKGIIGKLSPSWLMIHGSCTPELPAIRTESSSSGRVCCPQTLFPLIYTLMKESRGFSNFQKLSETCKFHLIPGPCMFILPESSESLSSLQLETVATQALLHLSVPDLCSLIFYPVSLPWKHLRVHDSANALIPWWSGLFSYETQDITSDLKHNRVAYFIHSNSLVLEEIKIGTKFYHMYHITFLKSLLGGHMLQHLCGQRTTSCVDRCFPPSLRWGLIATVYGREADFRGFSCIYLQSHCRSAGITDTRHCIEIMWVLGI